MPESPLSESARARMEKCSVVGMRDGIVKPNRGANHMGANHM